MTSEHRGRWRVYRVSRDWWDGGWFVESRGRWWPFWRRESASGWYQDVMDGLAEDMAREDASLRDGLRKLNQSLESRRKPRQP